MLRRHVLALLIIPVALAQRKAGPPPKPPEVEVLEASARRENRGLAVDARLRNTGERPVTKLTILVEFLDSDKKVLSQQKGEADEPVLEPGQETEFHRQTSNPARAVYFTIRFEDGSGREVRGVNPGPFPIE